MKGNLLLLLLVLWPFIGSAAVAAAGRKGIRRRLFTADTAALVTALTEALILAVCIVCACTGKAMSVLEIPYIESMGLSFRLDGFRIVYASITVFMWICSIAISKEYFNGSDTVPRYYIFCLWTFAATVGVFISADLFTTFTFFEIMSLASYVFVAHTEKKDALRAAETYLAVAVIGGLVMLMGLLMLYSTVGTLDIMLLKSSCAEIFEGGSEREVRDIYIAGGLILFGFGAKAGMFPLHIWLPKAHPVAPAPASALLSGVLTKSGIFGVLILCLEVFSEGKGFGTVIILLGVVTMFTGALLAVFSVDLKRTLACSSVSQIGFILIGVGLVPLLGEECTLAMSGAMLYMVNHSLFKLTLFLSAAAVYMKCHMLNLNDIRGYGRDMPLLKIIFAIGALGISGVPLLSGYISKTLIHEGIVEYIGAEAGTAVLFKIIEILFLISGGMTFSYMMKLFHAIFVDAPETECKYAGKDKRISAVSYAAIILPAAAIVLFGLCPKLFIGKLAVLMGNFNTGFYNEEQLEVLDKLRIFSFENLKGSLISLGIGCLLFVLIRLFLTEGDRKKAPVYINRWPAFLDLEELVYRPLLCRFLPFLFRTVGAFIAVTLPKIIWRGIMIVSGAAARFISTTSVRKTWAGIMVAAKRLGSILGNCFAEFIDFLSRTLFAGLHEKEHPVRDRLKEEYEEKEKHARIIASGISYGMMFICIGLCVTLFYLLYLLFV